MNTKVLCVDDEPNVLAGFQRTLRRVCQLDVALSGPEALLLLESQGPYAVLVADMQMPEMNGIELLARARERAPDTIRVMLTGNADQKTAVDAVNAGQIFQFLNKPCAPEGLAQTLQAAIHQHALITAERELLEQTLNGSVQVLVQILSLQDPHSFGLSQTLRTLVREFAQSLKVQSIWDMEMGAMLAQIGRVTLPGAILQKVRQGVELAPKEAALLARVPEIGESLLVNIPRLKPVAAIVRYQAKHFDGTGLPQDDCAGEAIPVGARVLKVLADLLELEGRNYTRAQALHALQGRVGRYDPRVLDAAFACFDVYLSEPLSAKPPARALPIQELEPGMILAADVKTTDDMVILAAGMELSEVLIEKIQNFAQFSGVVEPIHVEA